MADTDGDGQPDDQEIEAGTDPNDPLSRYGFEPVIRRVEQKLRLYVANAASFNDVIEESVDAGAQAAWSVVDPARITSGTDARGAYLDVDLSSAPGISFFRMTAVPTPSP